MKIYRHIGYGLILLAGLSDIVQAQNKSSRPAAEEPGIMERQYLVQTLTRIADPVLNALSVNQLRKTMPVEAAESKKRAEVTHLEAFGRLLAGMAPWLELGPDETPEGRLRKKYIDLVLVCLHNAVDPASPDRMNFNEGRQPLVDAAILAEGMMRAPVQLWGHLDQTTRTRLLEAWRSTRIIMPSFGNWTLFSASIEAALLKFDGPCDRLRIDYAQKLHEIWYKGDGAYGDGQNFHWDYYNSFVIHPMLLEVTQATIDADHKEADKKLYDTLLKRSQRYAAILERMISPEATYPPMGRSLAYRFGAFHLLSKIALMHKLPEDIKPQQVRFALYSMIKKQSEAPGTFDKNGWLQIGLYGHEPGLGETYISTGSLYFCSQAFLILGLPPADEFWQGKDEDWTSRKIWKGEDMKSDHAL